MTSLPDAHDSPALVALAEAALKLVPDGARVGLGSGHTAAVFIKRLGALVRDGLRIGGVPTSGAAARLAIESGIPIITLLEDVRLDLTVDGADEVAPNLDLIKGLGGALVRERIVAAASDRQVIIVQDSKLVRALGERCRIPVEVVPMAAAPLMEPLRRLGLHPVVRLDASGANPLVNENGNMTIDCAVATPLVEPESARALEASILALAGVVDTGLFLGTAERVLVGHADGRVVTLMRGRPE